MIRTVGPVTPPDTVEEPEAPESPSSIWIGTEWLADGTGYRAVLNITDDHSVALVGDRVFGYVRALLQAAMFAAYDAAIVNQWTRGLHREPHLVVEMIHKDIRPDRPTLDHDATAPLKFLPQVVQKRDGGPVRAVVRIHLDGTGDLGTWELAEVRDHVANVLTIAQICDLDSGYWRYLAKTVGVDPQQARGIVHDAGLWLLDGSVEPTSHRLARDLREAGVPMDLVDDARDCRFDDYSSDSTFPQLDLVKRLTDLGRHDLVERVVAGEWDGSKAESAAWANGPEGQQAFAEFSALIEAAAREAGSRRNAAQRGAGYSTPRPGARPKRDKK